MPISRRHLLASSVLFFFQDEAVRVHVAGAQPGATLALDEMTRTTSLLGRAIDRASHPSAMAIDLREQSISSAGQRYLVSASPKSRAAALAEWRDRRATAAVEWHPALVKYGAEQLNARFLQRFGKPMDSGAWVAWMLVKIAVDAQLRDVTLAEGRFDGHKGAPLAFGDDRHLAQPLCLVDAAGALLGVTE